jgi:hypothetical protein
MHPAALVEHPGVEGLQGGGQARAAVGMEDRRPPVEKLNSETPWFGLWRGRPWRRREDYARG